MDDHVAPLVVTFEDDGSEVACQWCGRRDVTIRSGHADDCPMTTGFYPYTEDESFTCEGCGCEIHPTCAWCHTEFHAGDTYRLVEMRTGLLTVIPDERGVAICLGCAERQRNALLDQATS